MASKSYVSERDAKYQRLLDISKRLAPEEPFLVLQKEVGAMWKTELQSGNNNALYEGKMEELRVKLQSKKGGIMAFMAKAYKVTADKRSDLEEVIVVLEDKIEGKEVQEERGIEE